MATRWRDHRTFAIGENQLIFRINVDHFRKKLNANNFIPHPFINPGKSGLDGVPRISPLQRRSYLLGDIIITITNSYYISRTVTLM